MESGNLYGEKVVIPRNHMQSCSAIQRLALSKAPFDIFALKYKSGNRAAPLKARSLDGLRDSP
jgi:hypothetical protein